MTANVGALDRAIRLVIGLALVGLALVLSNYWLLIPAAVALGTAAMRFCPLWLVLGIKTLNEKVGLKG